MNIYLTTSPFPFIGKEGGREGERFSGWENYAELLNVSLQKEKKALENGTLLKEKC